MPSYDITFPSHHRQSRIEKLHVFQTVIAMEEGIKTSVQAPVLDHRASES